MDKGKVLLVGTPKTGASRVTGSLKDLVPEINVVGQLGEALTTYDKTLPAPSVVLVAVDGEPSKAFEAVHGLHERGAKTLVLGDSKDPDLILQALRAGASEFVVASDEADL